MYLIPFYPLPSDPNTMVQFRAPDVAMATYFCKSEAYTEERDTTEYLNLLQTAETKNDSVNWTAQDRRTALWWIFINSRKDPMISFGYQCSHCGEEHWSDVNMQNLADDLTVLDVKPEMDAGTITVQGEPYEWICKPLDGHAMECLERMRQNLPPAGRDRKAYERAVTALRLWELVYQVRLADDTEKDFETSAVARHALIEKMDVNTEFTQLAAKVGEMQEKLDHGLKIRMDKGESCLLMPPHPCNSDKFKEAAIRPTTELLVTFRNSQFIPNIGTGSLANLSFQPGLVWRSANF
ncbi:morphogenetic protein [Chimaeribacter californicus]|uniref:Morphogenetic protein n=1 Tax=Chimaeribacter californicus TaxID=2060067 RepID=A0A2N5DT78_9GAMM|nr:morphogenetic protein [Chimaeribacter californicus]PLR29546.1 morphogenetic protein [Chimaeribacter californicus]